MYSEENKIVVKKKSHLHYILNLIHYSNNENFTRWLSKMYVSHTTKSIIIIPQAL